MSVIIGIDPHKSTHTAVAVDRFLGQREVIVKSLGRHAARLEGVAGAIDLEGGRVALLIDLTALVANDTMAEAAG